MADKKHVLVIDLGTSGCKSALATTDGDIVGFEFEKYPLYLLPGNGAEQSPEEWWRAIVATSRRLASRNICSPGDIIAVCCTGQWSGTVPVDRNGKSLMNAIIWLDSRGSAYAKELSRGIVSIQGYGFLKLIRWLRLTGGCPSLTGKDPVAHILYIKNEFPEIYRETYKFIEPKDYINLRLTGNYASSFDSIALHWVTDNRNINDIRYNKKLIKLSTIDPEKLPPLKSSVDILGRVRKDVAEELGISGDAVVVMGTPDVQSAAVGSGAVRDYQGHVYIGTSSWITCHVPFKKTDILHSIASLPSAVPGRYFVANEQETAGACLEYLKKIFFRGAHGDGGDTYREFDRIAEGTEAGSGGVIFTPWLNGERSPVENNYIRGAFFNQTLGTGMGHLIRSVYEGVAYNSRWLLTYVEKFIKRRFEPLTLIGGGANSDIWCQIYADVLNRTIRKVKQPIMANLRGAAFLSLVATGSISFDMIPECVKTEKIYTPNPGNRDLYDEMYREFRNIFKSTGAIYRRLNKKRF